MIIGVDPGISGALALLHDNGSLAAVLDMPTVTVQIGGTNRNRLATNLLVKQVSGWQRNCASLTAIVEDVATMPRDGAVGAFTFGYSKGVIEGVLSAFMIPLVLVKPVAWKRAAGLTDDKGASRIQAMRRWPEHAEQFKRVRDDGRAEACLIAAHGLRHF